MNKMTKNYNKCKRLIWSTFNVEENEPLFTKSHQQAALRIYFPLEQLSAIVWVCFITKRSFLSRSLNTMTVHIRVCSCSTQVSPWVEYLSAGGLSTCIYGMVDVCNQFT